MQITEDRDLLPIKKLVSVKPNARLLHDLYSVHDLSPERNEKQSIGAIPSSSYQ